MVGRAHRRGVASQAVRAYVLGQNQAGQ
jgi:hypothetical protein